MQVKYKIWWVEFYSGAPGKVSANNIADIYRWFPGNVKRVTLIEG